MAVSLTVKPNTGRRKFSKHGFIIFLKMHIIKKYLANWRRPFRFIKRGIYFSYHWHLLLRALNQNKLLSYDGEIRGKKVIYGEADEGILEYFEGATGCQLTSDIHDAEVALHFGACYGRGRCKYLRSILNHKIPIILVEGGFINSISTKGEISKSFGIGLSFIIDHIGIYYDVNLGSSVACLLNSEWKMLPEEEKAADIAINFIKENCLTKYNVVKPEKINFNPAKTYRSVVLVADQRRNDQSITAAGADEKSFKSMLHDAIYDNPGSLILVKIHPDQISGRHQGYFDSLRPREGNVKVISKFMNPISLLKSIDKVYVVSSQIGMEALLCGKEVICYGAAFYAGWGLTVDRGSNPKRQRTRSLRELFHASYLKFTHYYNPATGKKSDLQDVLEYLSANTNKL